MKNTIILALCVIIALLALSGNDRSGVQSVIEDTTLHHATYREGPPMLAAPCQPIPPRNFPRWMQRKA